MSVNLASRVRGSGVGHYKGVDLRVKDVMAVDFDLEAFEITDDMFGALDTRMGGRGVKVTFTPDGVWTVQQLAVLYPWLNPTYGDFSTPRRYVSAIDTVAGNITSDGHGQITGTGVRVAVQTGGTLPGGLSATTTYFAWCDNNGNTVQLYTTEAQALASDGVTILTGQVIPTSAGSEVVLIVNSPFTITTQDGFQLVVENAAISDMPDNTLGSTVSAMKQVTVVGYTLHAQNWSDANSIVSYATGVALTAVPPNKAQIPTVPYTIDWANRLPVVSATTATGILNIPKHGLVTGQALPFELASTGATLPGGLTVGTVYYAIVEDVDNIKVATSSINATAGTNITLTSTGSGTFNAVPLVNLEGMKSREATEVSYKIDWEKVPSDENGIDCHQLNKLTITVSFVPTNVTWQSLFALLNIQGGTAARGQSLPAANMDIYGPGFTPFLRFYGMELQNNPARMGKSADRVDKLTFKSTRVFRGNVPAPLGFVGIAAPTS